MKRFVIFTFICVVSGFVLFACGRDEGVQAGNESGYRPRPAPANDVLHEKTTAEQKHEMTGELMRVDTAGKTVVLRLENGMMQTFKVDDATAVEGLKNQPTAKAGKSGKDKTSAVRSLVGKEGSEVKVHWDDVNAPKMARTIEVTEVATAKNTKGAGR